ncbi:acyltransferase family protein [Streptomyces roseifaciens]|uniref:acyltransferase family protein n=1 Tax=Streptomyces roseifaciens TaxID=1488406 RepID=UPI0009A07CE0|nr:acyltransferase [Streptomyces roseifaciens]
MASPTQAPRHCGSPPWSALRGAPPHARDRAVDGLRAFAVLGVVGGHWLVTALVADGGSVHGASPLTHLPGLAPASWLFQTLAVFFLVSGQVGVMSHASARARGMTYGQWLRGRLVRLFRPVVAVLAVWAVVTGVLLASGTGTGTVLTLLKLVWSPLWFLLVLAALTAATPLVAKVSPWWPFAVVLCTDVIRFGLDGPAWPGWVNVAAGWLVPYCLGAAWARGRLRSRATGLALLAGGVLATALLVTCAGYPAAMVGVPGAQVSNLSPPTLAAVTFGLAQCGAALLLLGPLRRVLQRPAAWTAVALVNLFAMTVFLWHQTSMMAVTGAGLLVGAPLPGLHTVPDGPGWVLARLAWLPVFGVALLGCWALFRRFEHGRPRSRGYTRVVREHRPGPAATLRRP